MMTTIPSFGRTTTASNIKKTLTKRTMPINWTWQELASRNPIREFNGWNVCILTRQKLAHLIVSSKGSNDCTTSKENGGLVSQAYSRAGQRLFPILQCAVRIGAAFDVIKVLVDAHPSSLTHGYQRGSSGYRPECPEKAAMYFSKDPEVKQYLMDRAIQYASQVKYSSWYDANEFFKGHCNERTSWHAFSRRFQQRLPNARLGFT